MNLFRPVYRSRSGTRRHATKWYVEFKDHVGRRRRVAAFGDKNSTKQFAMRMKRLLRSQKQVEARSIRPCNHGLHNYRNGS